jgi:glycerophosphoryl diester phosphodiesterase
VIASTAVRTLFTTAMMFLQPAFPLSAPRKVPLVCSHRGRLNAGDLENSVSVIRHTFAAGIPMVEFDLVDSKEGHTFLVHDRTLDRTTDAKGAPGSYSDAQLSKVMQLDPVTRKLIEPVSTFEQLLDFASGNNLALMVDLKSVSPAEAVSELRVKNLLAHAVLLTFDEATTEAALHADPAVVVSSLVKSDAEIDRIVAKATGHPLALYVPQDGAEELFQYARRSGKAVITDAMGGLDNKAEMDGGRAYVTFLKTHPVDILVTDHAQLLTKALSEHAVE